ncbi:MAG: hypothetical protein EOP04_18010 [Proteobacteria bacterium]|nr:MAG: hypothetical protein EOP04_18010 [Pseudomonadota bacterium]
MTSTWFAKPVLEVVCESPDSTLLYRDVPFVLKGSARDWPAYEKWDIKYLVENCPLSEVSLRDLTNPGSLVQMELKNYLLLLMTDCPSSRNLYLGSWDYKRFWPALSHDVGIPNLFGKNLINAFKEIIHFPSTTLFLGHAGTYTKAHTDVYMVGTYLSQIRGSKHIRLCDSFQNNAMHPEMNLFDSHTVSILGASGHEVYDVILEPGDIVYFPPGWWHQVENLGYSLAISHNFVSEANVPVVEQQIRSKLLKPLFELRNQLSPLALSDDKSEATVKTLEHASFDKREALFKSSILSTIQLSIDFLANNHHQNSGSAEC